MRASCARRSAPSRAAGPCWRLSCRPGIAGEIRLRAVHERPFLSDRESEILKLVADGLTAPEIGAQDPPQHRDDKDPPAAPLREARRKRASRGGGRRDASRAGRVATLSASSPPSMRMTSPVMKAASSDGEVGEQGRHLRRRAEPPAGTRRSRCSSSSSRGGPTGGARDLSRGRARSWRCRSARAPPR